MVELHIFDFDGTLFFSPTAEAAALEAALKLRSPSATDAAALVDTPEVAAKKLHGLLRNPVSTGGLGWYQSLLTLSPPAVPARPEEGTWYVQPILAHMRAIVAARNAMLQKKRRTTVVGAGGKSTSAGPDGATDEMPLLYVLTGRDTKYHDRIWTLLQHVGLDTEVEDVLLKPHETAGTVKYKLNQFFSLIQYHQPNRVFYYEDRVEQGGRLLEGVRVLEEMLYGHTRDGAGGAPGQGCSASVKPERVGVATFDAAVAVAEGEANTTAAPAAPCETAATPAASSASAEGAHNAAPSPSPLLQRQLPQPTVVPLTASTAAHTRAVEAHLLTIESALRASPYELLRNACYPVDRRVAFYGAPAAAAAAAAGSAAAESPSPAESEAAAAAAALRSAERQAQRWLEETVEYHNGKQQRRGGGAVGGGRGGGGKAGRGGSASLSAAAYDPRALRRAVTFAVPPPFVFVMVLVPAAVCGRCAGMLTNAQLRALVQTLQAEQSAAAAAVRS